MPSVPEQLQGISQFFHYQREHGHGHVFPRNDGAIARCMGPTGCAYCKLVKEVLDSAIRYNQMETPNLRLVIEGKSVHVERFGTPL